MAGLMGTGKTTTGRILAARLGWPMRDSDEEIQRAEGRTVRELRNELGTDAMHELEAQALLRALARGGPDVIGAAASTVDRKDCRAALVADGVAVAWLTARPETAARRFATSDHRPSFGDDPQEFLARQGRERAPLFRQLDAIEVATDERTPEAVADAVLAGLRTRGVELAG